MDKECNDKKDLIGIYTFWNVPNYGTFAQAYALQKVLEKMFPNKQVRQIAYLDKKHYGFYYSCFENNKPWTRSFYSGFIKRMKPENRKKRKLFLEAYDTIPHTKNFSARELQETKFDAVVLGSDIIWDYSFKCFNNDPFLFGNGFKSKKLISYAGSFGTIKRNSNYPQYVVEGLRHLDEISVREENSANIVKDITGIDPELVLDPTWLWDFNTDSNVVESPYKDYMVVYGQDFTPNFKSQIIEYCKEKHLMLVCLDCNNDNYDWCDVVLRQHQLSPYQWFGIFKGANAIATSTFHGLTFSLIFQKKLAFCKSDFILAKAKMFLRKLELLELYTKEDATVKEMLDRDWDYTKINKIIEKERSRSISYLHRALE